MTRSTLSSEVEVYGQSVQALVNAMEFLKLRAQRILASHGIETLQADKWYPMNSVLSSFNDILAQVGPHTTRAIGHAIPKSSVFPPAINSFESALLSLDQAYRMNHRGTGDIGSYRYVPGVGRTAQMVCDNPYPCDFDQGIMEALYDRFQPKGSIVLRIEHDAVGCRAKGARSCSYRLKW
ncbi:hypothetical protein [Archangium violaceum]|uniref:hypothetical protein n=1 Tax=Archangium violaceum TaxID=83451 RepID=UPI001EF71AD6|nr:hypothetical protein [Archangium violaceum]